jgi:hypothetical protein
MPTIHSSTDYILSVLCVSMFRFLYCSSFYFCFPKHKKTKNISTFGLLYLLFLVWYLKNPKIFCFVRYFLSLLFQKLKTQKYLLFFFGFVKFVAEFSLSLLHWSLVFTSYYSNHTSEKAIMMTYDNPRCGKRLV